MKCCGPEGPDSYNVSEIPSSCCKVSKNDTVCNTADRTQIRTQSCIERTYEDMVKFSSYFNIVPNNNATSRPRSTSS